MASIFFKILVAKGFKPPAIVKDKTSKRHNLKIALS